MFHLNGNLLCVVACDFTGFDTSDYLYDIVIAPLGDDLEFSGNLFRCLIKPPVLIDLRFSQVKEDRKKYYVWLGEQVSVSGGSILESYKHGLEEEDAADMLVRWFERLGLPDYKQVMVLAHNWSYQQYWVQKWLGLLTYRQIFHPYVRDTVSCSLLQNDSTLWSVGRRRPAHKSGVDQYPWPKNSLSSLANSAKMPYREGGTVLDKARQIQFVYKKMVTDYIALGRD